VRIALTRSGGIAAIARRAVCDLEALAPARRERLQALVEASGLLELPEVVGRPAPDRYQYDLEIETGPGRRRVRVHEAAAAPALRALLDELIEISEAST